MQGLLQQLPQVVEGRTALGQEGVSLLQQPAVLLLLLLVEEGRGPQEAMVHQGSPLPEVQGPTALEGRQLVVLVQAAAMQRPLDSALAAVAVVGFQQGVLAAMSATSAAVAEGLVVVVCRRECRSGMQAGVGRCGHQTLR
jgi:hypothetical protein